MLLTRRCGRAEIIKNDFSCLNMDEEVDFKTLMMM